jgi:MoxR-like ATPase
VRIEKVKSAVDVRTAYKNRDESTFNDGDTVEEDGKTIINGVKDGKTTIQGGTITCNDVFPLIVLTSNGERDFPPAFLRRCVRLTMEEPGETRLREIVDAHLAQQQQQTEEPSFLNDETIIKLIQDFVKKRNDRTRGDLATDQLLNAVYIVMREREPNLKNREDFINRLWKHLSSSEDQRSDSSPRS